MDEKTLLYGLMIATTVNTVLLIVLVAVLIRLSLTVNRLMLRVESLLQQGQRELWNTLAVARRALRQGGDFLGKLTMVVERYMLISVVNRLSPSPRLSKVISGMGIGFGIVQSLRKLFRE